MFKKTKGILLGLLLLLAVVLSGCGDPYANVYVAFEGESTIEIVLGETPNNTIAVVSSIHNFKAGMSDLMFFSPDRSVVKIDKTETLGSGKTRVTITGIKPGTVKLKAQTLEGSKSATITINVLQPMTDFSIKSSAHPYIMRGSTTTLYPLDHVDFSPISTTEKNILIEIKDLDLLSGQGVTFEDNAVFVPETYAEKSITVVFSAYKMVNGIKEVSETISSKELTFSVISPIDTSDVMLYALSSQGIGFNTQNIRLLSNNIYFSQRMFYIEVLSPDFELDPIEEFVSLSVSASNLVVVSNVSLENLSGGRRIYFTLQSSQKSGIGNIVVNLSYLNNDFALSKSFPVVVEVVSERIEVNEKTVFGNNEFVSTYTEFSSLSGTPINFMVYPTDCASKYSVLRMDYFSLPANLLLFTIMGVEIKEPTNLTPQEQNIGRRIDSGIVLYPSYLEIASGTTIYVRGLTESEQVHELKAYLPLDLKFDANGASTDILSPIEFIIPIKVVRGATQLSINQEVIVALGENGEVQGYEKEFSFLTDPVDAYADDFSIFANTNLATFQKLNGKTFKLIPHNSGQGTFSIFLGNGTYKQFNFEIISTLKESSIVLDIESSDSIGYKNQTTTPMEFAIKATMDALLKTSYEPQNASVVSITYSSANKDVISIVGSNRIKGVGVGGQDNKIVVSARIVYRVAQLDEGVWTVVQQERTVNIRGECYVPLKSFTMSKSKIQIYDYNTVGYYNKEISQSLLLPIFSPINATYRSFTATDQSVNNAALSKFLISFSNPNYHISHNTSTDFLNQSKNIIFQNEKNGIKPTIYTEYMNYNYATNLIEANIKAGYLPSASSITFTIKEFDSEFSFSVEFAPLLQAKVETITLKNCSPDSEIYLDANRRVFQIIADGEPLEAYNRTLKYAFFPPLGGGNTAEVSVNNNGLITLINSTAGKGFIRVSAEDSYSSSTEPTTYVDIPIRVADGSKENPYSLRTEADLRNIKGDGLSKFYVLESNINLGNVSWTPLGIFTGGITGNGLFTISGILLDDVSVAAAKTLRISDDTIRDDAENNLQTAARIRVGLFTKINGELVSNEYVSGYIKNVVFSGTINISNSESNLLLDVGLITAQNDGEISGCSVNLASASVRLSTGIIEYQINLTSRVGGMAGLNTGLIANHNTIQPGTNFVSSNVGVQMLGQNTFIISGINVAFGMMVGQQGEVGFGSVPARNGSINWQQVGTAFENQYQTVVVKAAVANSLTRAMGGVAGINLLGSGIVGAHVSGSVIGYSNVGGLAGLNHGFINNCVSHATVSSTLGGENTGGLVGQHSGTISNSYVEIYDQDTINGEVVKGVNSVGGIAGLMTEGLIESTYFVSYHNNSTKSSISLNGTLSGSAGGLVGTLRAGTIREVFSHATVAGSGVAVDYLGSLIGTINNTSPILIENFYTKSNHGTDQTTNLQPVGSQLGDWGASVIRYGYSYYQLNVDTTPTSHSSGSVYSTTVYFGVQSAIDNFTTLNTTNDWYYAFGTDRPLIKFNGAGKNVDAPTGLVATVIKNQMTSTNGGTNLVAWMEFYQAVDSQQQSLLNNHNSFLLSTYFQIVFSQNNPTTTSYNILNNNTEVVSVQNGIVTAIKAGVAVLTITSKYNSADRVDLYLYITPVAIKLDLFVGADFSGKLGERVTLILKRDETRKLFAQTSSPNINVYSGETLFSVEIVKNSQPILSATETTPGATENSLAFDFATGFFNITGTQALSAGSFVINVSHRLQIAGKNYQSVIAGVSKNINHKITIGAKSISTSTALINTVPYFKNMIDVMMETDDVNDVIEIVISKTTANSVLQTFSVTQVQSLFKGFANSFEYSNGKMLLKTVQLLNQGVFANYISGSFHLELNESEKFVEEVTTFTINFIALNGLTATVVIVIYPQPVLDINVSQFNKLSNSEPSSETSNIITPGITAAFTLTISPVYASFDYLDIVSANPTNIIIALSVMGSTSTQNVVLLPNGIRLQRSFVKYLIDNYGRVKVGILCGSAVADQTVISVQITTAKSGVVSDPKFVSYIARNSVKVTKLEVSGVREGNDNILVQGVEYPIAFETTGNPDSIEFVSNQAYTISKRNGNYFLVPNSTETALARTFITVNLFKVVDSVSYTNSESIAICITKAAILAAPVEDLDYSKQVIRTPKGNAVTLDALFEYGSSILYNQYEWNIETSISLINSQAIANAVWEYSAIGENNWQRLGLVDIYTDSFQAVGKTITILKNTIPYKFRMSIRVAYDFSNTATYPTIVTENATTPTTSTFVNKVQEFTFEVFENTGTQNAIPVRTQEDLMNMQIGKHYILLEDIHLNNDTFRPIQATMASFNGNNKKIYLPSVITVAASTNTEFALFSEIAAGTLIENVTIAVASNVSVQVTGTANYSTFNFAALAVRNHGIITNCEVVSLHNPNNDLLQVNQPFRIYVEATSSGKTIASAGLVVNNGTNGTITNSRVQASILGPMNVAGFVHENSGKISSSVVNGVSMGNYDASSSFLSGFVNKNSYSGEIFSSFTEGGFVAQYQFGQYSLTTMHSTLQKVESIDGNAASFVSENSGKITDCFANITTIAKNYASGFVYENKQSASIKNCFSLSLMQANNNAATAFVGRNEVNRILNDGVISSSAYYKDTGINTEIYPNTDIAGLISLTKAQFTDRNHSFFASFSISADSQKTKGVWFIPSGNFEADFKNSATSNMIFFASRPHLVSPNIIARSEYILISYELSDQGVFEYTYHLLTQNSIGSAYNPYVVYNKSSFLSYILDNADQFNRVNKHYRLVADINFGSTTVQTSHIVFNGDLEGNGMRISSLVLESETTQSAAGFFASIGDKNSGKGSVKNLTLSINKMYLPNTISVGGLAGAMYAGNVANISVVAGLGSSSIIGKNITGGVIGLSQIIKESRMFNLVSNISTVSLFQRGATSFNIEHSFNQNELYTSYSYAGAIFGVILNSSLYPTTVSDLRVYGAPYVMADNAGMIAGYVGKSIVLNKVLLEGSQNMFVRASRAAGGIIGELVAGSVSNITMSGLANAPSFFNTTTTWPFYAGGVAGVVRGGTISNAINSIAIYISPNLSTSKKTIVGGIAGLLNTQIDAEKATNQTNYYFRKSGLITGSANSAVIRAEVVMGGIVGSTLDAVAHDKLVIGKTDIVSGITRFSANFKVNVTNCTNNAKLESAANNQYKSIVGGIVGISGSETQIKNSYNKGEVIASSIYNSYAGGIVGEVQLSQFLSDSNDDLINDAIVATKNITNSLITRIHKSGNTAKVTAKNLASGEVLSAGGIVGRIQSLFDTDPLLIAMATLEFVYNHGIVAVEGKVSIAASYGGVGGVVGEISTKGLAGLSQTYNAGNVVNTNSGSREVPSINVLRGGISGRGGTSFISSELWGTTENSLSFFLQGMEGVGNSPSATWTKALTQVDLKDSSKYINADISDVWDFTTRWIIDPLSGYPILR